MTFMASLRVQWTWASLDEHSTQLLFCLHSRNESNRLALAAECVPGRRPVRGIDLQPRALYLTITEREPLRKWVRPPAFKGSDSFVGLPIACWAAFHVEYVHEPDGAVAGRAGRGGLAAAGGAVRPVDPPYLPGCLDPAGRRGGPRAGG